MDRDFTVTLLAAALGVSLISCAPMSAKLQDVSTLPNQESVDPGAVPVATPNPNPAVKPDLLSCLQSSVDYELGTRIESFQITNGQSFGGGFNPSAGFPIHVSAEISHSSGELDMSMSLTAPLFGAQPIAHGLGKGATHNFHFSVDLAAQLVSVKAEAYNQTGLYDVTKDALANSFTNLKSHLPTPPTWSTVISKDLHDGTFMIPIGSVAGVRKGDRFKIFKVDYVWVGDPCQSALVSPNKRSDDPVATVTVMQAEYYGARVQVTRGEAAELAPYDRVEIEALVKPKKGEKREGLKYSLRLGRISQSNELHFSDGQTDRKVDLTLFSNGLLNDFLANQDGEFYLVE